MKFLNRYSMKVFTTGFVVLLILSILLFWARKTCQSIFYEELVVGQRGKVVIQPSGLLPQLDSNPEVFAKSSIDAAIRGDQVVFYSLGAVRNLFERTALNFNEFHRIRIDDKKKNYHEILFDENLRLFVFYDVSKAKRGWKKKALLYAGPKGISETTDQNLGRFSRPKNNLWKDFGDTLMVFDKSHSCFFKINFTEKTVVKSSQYPDVIQMGDFLGFAKLKDTVLWLNWSPPLREQTSLDKENKNRVISSYPRKKNGTETIIDLVSAEQEPTGIYSKEEILILKRNGDIHRLNQNTLEISNQCGFLPTNPANLFSYVVLPFTVKDRYTGTIVATLEREAMAISVTAFDKEGRLLDTKRKLIHPSTMPGGPALMIAMYLLENLQPASFQMLSYLTASSFEAVQGHTGLFILPNSIVAIFNREPVKGIIGPLFVALLIISPSILLGLILGFLVYKDATITGFPSRTRRYWFLGTILFGLTAYITYKLTKPRETLVTCQNCGKMRRPDRLKCHRCGSPWHIPELTPPSWRVVIEPEKEIAEAG